MAVYNESETENGLSLVGRRLATVCFTFEGILGIVCALYSLRRSLRSGSTSGGYVNFFTSLAVADLGIAVLCPITAYSSAIASGGWPFSTMSCNMYGFVALFFGSIVIWSLLLGALDDEYKTKGTKLSIYLLPLAWINALFWSMAPLLCWGRYIPERYNAGCLYDMDVHNLNTLSYMIGYTVSTLFVPIGIIAWSKVAPSKGIILALASICFCWGLYGVEETWVMLSQDKEAVPIELVTAAPIAAKLSPIVNALIIGEIAPNVASQKSKTK